MDVRRPTTMHALAGFVLAGTLLLTGCSSPDDSTPEAPTTSSSAANTAPKGMPSTGIREDPNALVKAADLKGFGSVCMLSEPTHPLNDHGQGVESIFTCGNVKIVVVEIRGEEAQAAWKQILGQKTYKRINDSMRLTSGTKVAVFHDAGEDSHFVSVGQLAGAEPLNDNELTKLGTLIKKRITA